MKKLISLLLVLSLVVGVLAGCAQEPATTTGGKENDPQKTTTAAATTTEADSNFNPTGYPIVDEKVTITMAVGSNVADPNQMSFIKYMEELTNVHIEWITIPTEEIADRLTLIWAGDEYPDAVLGGQTGLPDPAAELYEDGVILPWNDLIDQYMPNFKEYCSDYFANIMYPDGNIYVMPRITGYYYKNNNQGVVINTKWLENVGMEMPTTIDEFTEVLRAFKEKDANGNGDPNDEIPYSTRLGDWADAFTMISGAFGIPLSKSPLVIDGEVVDPLVEESQIEAVKYLAMLYKEGLIDAEIFTQDVNSYTAKCKETPTRVGVSSTWRRGASYGDAVGEAEYDTVAPLAGSTGHKGWAAAYTNVAVENVMYLTSSCENPEIIARWVDTLYDPLHSYLAGYGALNESVFMAEDGKQFYRVNPAPEGYDTLAAYVSAAHLQHTPSMWNTDRTNEWLYVDPNAAPKWQDNPEMEAVYVADPSTMFRRFPSGKFFTAEEQGEMDLLKGDIQKYQEETFCRWICGQGDVEAEWDAYIAGLEGMNHERYLEIYQEVWDRLGLE